MDVASANGTALAGDDYEAIAAGQTLTIPAGATSGTVQVATIGDVNDEADETFFVNLSNAVDSSFADNQAVVTIDDDDGVGGAGSQLSIDDVTLSEGNSGTTTATFTVTRTLPNSGVATVDYATAGATATPGADFAPETGTLIFALGDASEEITIDVVGDRLDELDETFFVNLSGASGAAPPRRCRARHDHRRRQLSGRQRRRRLHRRGRRRSRSRSWPPTRTTTSSSSRSSISPSTAT